jgi:hypothetical protein
VAQAPSVLGLFTRQDPGHAKRPTLMHKARLGVTVGSGRAAAFLSDWLHPELRPFPLISSSNKRGSEGKLGASFGCFASHLFTPKHIQVDFAK